MLDIKLLRENIIAIADNLKKRGFILDITKFNQLESNRKELQNYTQSLQNNRNSLAKEIGFAKKNNEPLETIADLLKKSEQINLDLKEAELKLNTVLTELNAFMIQIPNVLHDSVPEGKNESDAKEIRRWGEPRHFDFTPKDHVDLGEALGLMDFESAAKITGARFVVLKNQLAKLQRALTQFMLDTHINQHNYTELYVPYIVNADSLYGTTQLPKFEEDLFKLDTDSNTSYYLIPTAEVPVTNLARDTIFSEKDLPQQFVTHTPCFRSEAGSYGKDTRGMIRQHQFEKVELVHFVKPDDSYKAHELLTQHAESILQTLNLPYRVIILAAGDTGFGSAKTHDIEVWLPSQKTYREISSCSNFESFQARRLQARYKNTETNKTEFIHTLNGSALAVGRTLVAILENYQNQDGSITIPTVLQPYMNNISTIR